MTHFEVVAELYGNDRYFGDYGPLIESFGNVLLREDDNDYQGDTYVLYDNPLRILIFGWGSCSGCDALQACYTVEDVAELRESLESQIISFKDKEELRRWMELRQESGSYYSSYSSWEDFAKKVYEYIGPKDTK